MKCVPVLIATALASAAFFASTTFAAPATSSTPGANVSKPVPIHVVSPTNLPWDFDHATVNLAFTIDEKGVPHDVRTVGRLPAEVASQLITAVSQWRFRPMLENGKPATTRVVLPLTLVSQV